MSESFKGDPVTAAQCTPDWVAERRAIIHPKGQALRAGANDTIEIKSITPTEQLAAHDPLRTNAWCTLALPKDATRFATTADRDAVLQLLTSENPSS